MMASRALIRFASLALMLLVAACGGGKGGYYSSDGPPDSVPVNLDAVPDAVPRIEPYASGPNKPYTVMGKSYTPDTSGQPYRKRGMASWYGKKFHGNKTSNGERYNMYAMTAAHPTLPIPSYARVTRVSNGRSVIVRINDRGPFLHNRVIDLSYVAAYKLGMLGPGSAEVIVESITHDDIRTGRWKNNGQQTAVAAQESKPVTVYEGLEPAAPLVTPVASQSIRITSSPAEQGDSIYLQIGAFREEANARQLAQRAASSMTQAQANVVIDQSVPDLFRVRIGPYPDRNSALQAAEPIYQSIGIMPTISMR